MKPEALDKIKAALALAFAIVREHPTAHTTVTTSVAGYGVSSDVMLYDPDDDRAEAIMRGLGDVAARRGIHENNKDLIFLSVTTKDGVRVETNRRAREPKPIPVAVTPADVAKAAAAIPVRVSTYEAPD